MGITSFAFLCFVAALLVLYYGLPHRCRWMVLCLATLFFFASFKSIVTMLYPIGVSLLSHIVAKWIGKTDSENEKGSGRKRIVLTAYLFLMFGVLFFLKYSGMLFHGGLSMPLGISFYSFILTGYVIDVYQGMTKPFSNPLHTFLAGTFFPLMISGPILNLREDGMQFLEEHPCRYRNVTFGAQRMLWGFFQKLVVSERLALVTDTVYADPETYGGMYVILGACCFTFRLYTDFSGCMDIVCGLGEMLGLRFAENFRAPLLATSISDFWRRWHITLGAWMRDHVFYPLLRRSFFTALSEKARQKLGKKKGKKVATILAMFVLWLAVGLWHGGGLRYVIGVGLLHWCYIVLGEWIAPLTQRICVLLHLKKNSPIRNALCVLRTFVLVSVGLVFFRVESTASALHLLKRGITVWNPHILFDGSLFSLGMNWVEWGVTAVSLVLLIVVNLMRYGIMGGALDKQVEAASDTGNYEQLHRVRLAIEQKSLPLRWGIWMAFLFYVILLGKYGPDFSAAEFIYKGF